MPVIEGDDGNNTINGGAGDDTLIVGIGDDTLNGGDGIDTAVFAGNLADFDIEDVGNQFDPNQLVVTEIGSGTSDVLNDIEFLRFDDRVVSVLDFIDDFGDTRDTAQKLEFRSVSKVINGTFPLNRAFGKTSIDVSGDVDGLTIFLDAGVTYEISAGFGFFTEDLSIVDVFDPNDTLVTETGPTDDHVFTFTASVSGEFFFTVAANSDSTSLAGVTVEELKLVGTPFSEELKGTAGDDTLFGNGGSDIIDGGGGVDVAVFDGDRDDFFVGPTSFGILRLSATSGLAGPFSEDTDSIFVFDVTTNQETELINVETLRFDDGDVSVLEFLDDFGDTAEEAGEFSLEKDSKFGKFAKTSFVAEGRIDTIGDVDAFTVDLEAGETFGIILSSESALSDGPGEVETDSTAPFLIESILDPDGNAVERVGGNVDDDEGVIEFFKANQSGTYLFSFAGNGEQIGDYFANLINLPRVGTDEEDSFITTPLDDVIDAKGGDDGIIAPFAGGTDFIDGGEGEDLLELDLRLEETQFAVSDEGEVTLTDAEGNVTTVINVELFRFIGDANVAEFTLEDLEAFAEQAGADVPFTLQIGDDDADELSGGIGNDIFEGGAGDDVITDAGGDNNVDGGAGADVVSLISGTNTVDGGTEDDLIIGGFGNDNLAGGSGNDVIVGDISTNLSGSDRIAGGAGDDLLEGRGGLDTFVFNINEGTDTIGALDIDFDNLSNTTVTGADFVSGLDVVELAGFGFADQAAAFANVTDVGGVATFSDQGTTIIFDGLTTADLSADDFILV